MTVRNLDRLFKPTSVALIGASKQPLSPGVVIARNLRGGGFSGPVMLVNPNHREIDGEICHPDVASLPATPDLAVVVTPPDTVPEIIAALGARGHQRRRSSSGKAARTVAARSSRPCSRQRARICFGSSARTASRS